MEALSDEIAPKTDNPQQELGGSGKRKHSGEKMIKASAVSARGAKIELSSTVDTKNDPRGGIKQSTKEKKVMKSKIQPKRRRKKYEWEESSEDEAEEEHYTDKESDGFNDVESEQPVETSECKCEKMEVTPQEDPWKTAICAKFTEISKQHHTVYTDAFELGGVAWKVSMHKASWGGITFGLNRVKRRGRMPLGWLCPVVTEVRCTSAQSEDVSKRIRRKNLFDCAVLSASIGSFSNTDLFKKGYVIDDSITVYVAMNIFPTSLKQTKEVRIHAKFTEISEFTEKEVHSEPSVVDGTTWNVGVKKERFDQFSFNLYGRRLDDNKWWGPVIAELCFLSHNTGKSVHIDTKKHIYDAHHASECLATIEHKDLFDGEKGFVRDDSILAQVVIKIIPTN